MDEEEHRFGFAARDRFGKTDFNTSEKRSFAFASEMKGLWAADVIENIELQNSSQFRPAWLCTKSQLAKNQTFIEYFPPPTHFWDWRMMRWKTITNLSITGMINRPQSENWRCTVRLLKASLPSVSPVCGTWRLDVADWRKEYQMAALNAFIGCFLHPWVTWNTVPRGIRLHFQQSSGFGIANRNISRQINRGFAFDGYNVTPTALGRDWVNSYGFQHRKNHLISQHHTGHKFWTGLKSHRRRRSPGWTRLVTSWRS